MEIIKSTDLILHTPPLGVITYTVHQESDEVSITRDAEGVIARPPSTLKVDKPYDQVVDQISSFCEAWTQGERTYRTLEGWSDEMSYWLITGTI